MRKTMAAALLATAALAGCDDDNNSTISQNPMSTVLEFARSLIGTQTCETTSPTEVNGRDIPDSETAITDLSTVNVGCSS